LKLTKSLSNSTQGIASLAGPSDEYFAYYDFARPESFVQAVSDLAEYVQSEGPFDGVMAFSQGATLAAALMARDVFPPPLGFAIFICGGPPFSERTIVEEGMLRFCENETDGGGRPVISVPTVHLIGAQDDVHAEGTMLVRLCREEGREFWEHPGGHEIPSAPAVTAKMVETICRGLEKALRAQ
jgi:predicted esterase